MAGIGTVSDRVELVVADGVAGRLIFSTMLQAIVDHPGVVNFDTSSLSNILYGASPASESPLRRTVMTFPGVRLTQGHVFIVDRAKDMVISGGEDIYSAEIENAVASHPAIAANAVIRIPHEPMGEAVHVALVLRPGCELTLQSLHAHCRAMIAGYRVPRSMEVGPNLPLSGAGKTLKTELREPFCKGRDRAVVWAVAETKSSTSQTFVEAPPAAGRHWCGNTRSRRV